MSEWAAKRFWAEATVAEAEAGFAVHLDGRPVKTPAKAPLVVPSRDFAQAIAAEWQAVDEQINPDEMPFTRSANAAIDKVSTQFEEVAEMLAAYGGSDLLCYRADGPTELIARQVADWDPVLDWASGVYGVILKTTAGLMPVDQTPEDMAALARPLHEATPFELTAMHDLVALSGSLVLALAVTQRHLTAAQAWSLSRLDEAWQIEQWGEDEEAAEATQINLRSFEHAARLYFMVST